MKYRAGDSVGPSQPPPDTCESTAPRRSIWTTPPPAGPASPKPLWLGSAQTEQTPGNLPSPDCTQLGLSLEGAPVQEEMQAPCVSPRSHLPSGWPAFPRCPLSRAPVPVLKPRPHGGLPPFLKPLDSGRTSGRNKSPCLLLSSVPL